MATVELEIPEKLLSAAQQAAQGIGITWSDFICQALEHETTLVHREQQLIDDAMLAYERTRDKYSNALKELAQ